MTGYEDTHSQMHDKLNWLCIFKMWFYPGCPQSSLEFINSGCARLHLMKGKN